MAKASGQRASELVAWLAPEEVDMRGEPQSFVELREGRRLMVLAQRGGACVLLGPRERCQAYAARPRDCRAFPFDFEPLGNDRRRLTLLPLTGCDYAEDGHNDAAQLAREDSERWQELSAYQRWVATWNRSAWHRRRLHKRLAAADEFLARALSWAAGEELP